MKFCIGYYIFVFITLTQARKNEFKIEEDERTFILLSSFIYLPGGSLGVSLHNFTLDPNIFEIRGITFGFTLEKVQNNFVDDAHIAKYRENCRRLNKRLSPTMSTALFFEVDRTDEVEVFNSSVNAATSDCLYLTANDDDHSYDTEFCIIPTSEEPGGLYHLVYHSCLNHDYENYVKTSFVVNIVERNIDSYLSFDDIMLRKVYFAMSAMFFLSAIFWTFTYCMSFSKIHYVMLSLVTLKTMNLLFHGMNYEYISENGEPMELLAILYYVSKVLTGVVQFTTIILIGSGWTFVRPAMLSSMNKGVLSIGIPLQVFAIVAEIMVDESEAGDTNRRLLWTKLFYITDSFSYFITLLFLLWSIKHLEKAATSVKDGDKAAAVDYLKNVEGPYMVACYIFFSSGMVVDLLEEYIVSSQHAWKLEYVRVSTTFLFFVLIGYKYRPRVARDSDNRGPWSFQCHCSWLVLFHKSTFFYIIHKALYEITK